MRETRSFMPIPFNVRVPILQFSNFNLPFFLYSNILFPNKKMYLIVVVRVQSNFGSPTSSCSRKRMDCGEIR